MMRVVVQTPLQAACEGERWRGRYRKIGDKSSSLNSARASSPHLPLRVVQATPEDRRPDQHAELSDARCRGVPGELAAGHAGQRIEERLEEHVQVPLENLLAHGLSHRR